MASPYDFLYTVQESDGVLEYPRGVCHQVGDTIRVPFKDKMCFFEDVLPANEPACCFSSYCPDNPYDTYRVPFEIPVDGPAIIPMPVIEGCKPPRRVKFWYCSNCAFLGIDAPPITDPTDPVGASGGGAYPNPQVLPLTGCEEEFYITACDGTVVKGIAFFYCD